MKFLCDNCKAKYQIADEKVAGKTVRMKCRKCGHQIEVRAAVTETSVSTSSPMVGGGTEMMRPVGSIKGGLATSLSAQKPRAPAPSQPAGAAGTGPYAAQGALAGAFQRAVSEPPQTMPMPTGGNNPVELSVTDEWYVAINGVPVGPVRITELRRKAASGAVTEDSLCWQEGLEEWRPVRSIPELAALVREAAQGNRPSLISPEPSAGRISSPPAQPRPPVGATGPQRSANAPMAPRATPAPTNPQLAGPVTSPSPQRSNVVPLRTAANLGGLDEIGGSPTTSPLGGAAAALAPTYPQPAPPAPAPFLSDPFAIPPAGYASAPAVSASDPFAIPAPAPTGATGPMQMAPVYAPSMLPPAPRRAVPLWFWPILLFTGMFGAAAAFFVFKQPQPAAPAVIQLAPTASAPPTTSVASEVPPPASAEPTAPTASASSASSGTKIASAAKTASTATAGGAGGAAATTAKQGLDLGGLVPSGGGPNVGGAGGGAPGTGGGLDSSSVQRVVASHQNGVKRTCWERGGAGGTSSANVTISAQVGPAGNVVGTSSTGDDPVVAKCIENQVKTWMFAAPGATTTVNIPFKFIKQ